MKHKHLLIAAALAGIGAAPAAAAPYTDLYVFGDSLVDAGNIQIVTGGAFPRPGLGYFDGRFTNGPDYTDLLSQYWFGSYTTPSLAGGNNFAFGGARAADNSGFSGASQDSIPDLGAQVGAYLARSGGAADSNALYVITATGNDIFAIEDNRINGLSQEAYIDLVAGTIAVQVDALDNAGARNILLTGVPNAGVASAYALQSAIDLALAGIELDAELFLFSFFDFYETMLTDPAELGLPMQDLSTTCIAARPLVNGTRDCTGIFSFDGTHPSAEIHAALFREVLAQVPEPAAVALFGLGIIGLGMARPRRGRVEGTS